jgi:hypothetical protein
MQKQWLLMVFSVSRRPKCLEPEAQRGDRMVRLFGHHVALPVAFLAVCELFLFILSFVAAL